jgi:guanine deaminase
MALTIRGTIMQTPTSESLEVLSDHVVSVGADGLIVSVAPASEYEETVDVSLAEGEILLPGLVDLHVHAPQWPQLGSRLDRPLEEWLFDYTFPLEARFSDLEFASVVWPSLVSGLLSLGTTTAVYYGSIHEPATNALAAECLRQGQRAFIGRVAMDHPEGTPDWYRDEDASAGVAASQRSIVDIEAIDPSGLVRPIITPRFIPACSDALLEGLGELASATGALVQTHCSESDWEHEYVIDRCGTTDATALESFGLLANGSVLAHAGHITKDDDQTLEATRSGIAHCPLSNSYFGNAVFPLRRVTEAGVRVGLGTDIAGGADPSLLRQCAYAVTASRMLEDGVDASLKPQRRGNPTNRIDMTTAFYLATIGGANVLGLNGGLLEQGRVFDAFVVRTGEGTSIARWPELDDDGALFERVVRMAGASDISTVWVNGKAVRSEAGDDARC